MNKIRHTGLVTNNLKKSLFFFWNKYLKFRIKKKAIESGSLIDKIMEYKKVKVETVKLSDNSGMIFRTTLFQKCSKKKKYFIKPYSMDLHIYL